MLSLLFQALIFTNMDMVSCLYLQDFVGHFYLDPFYFQWLAGTFSHSLSLVIK